MKNIGMNNRVLAWRLPAGLGVLALILLLLTGVVISAEPPLPLGTDLTADSFVAGELLVRFNAGVTAAAQEDVLAQVGANYIRHLYMNDVQLWQVAEGEELAAIDALNKLGSVDYAEPNYLYTVHNVIPNDPEYHRQWAHPIMNSPAGWDVTIGSSNVVIAILDTGVDMNHPDLAAKIVPGYDFIEGDNNPTDLFGHGTHVAGIAGAVTHNGIGIAGVDWQTRIMPVRVLNDTGTGTNVQVTDGIVFAYSNGADVINLSLGGPSYSQSMQNAVNQANANETLVVASMGNDRGNNPPNYPAAYGNVMAVAATNDEDQYSFYSQYGQHNDISAPGGEMFNWHDNGGIYSTMPTYEVFLTKPPYQYFNNYDYLQGTSMATPQVSGLAALILSLAPGMEPDDVEGLIKSTAVDLGSPGWDQNYGYGRINIAAALAVFAVLPAPTLDPIDNQDGNYDYTVSWNAVANANNYILETDTSPSFSTPTVVYNGAATSRPITNPEAGWHYYRVKAQGTGGDSGWSNTSSVVLVPNAPVLNAINNGGGNDAYTVDWQAAGGAHGYALEVDDNPGFNSPQVQYMGPATSYAVTGQAGGTWHYRVQAYNEAGFGDFSNTEPVNVDPAALNAPTLSPINTGDTYSYTVNWSAVAMATGYILEESTNPYFVNPSVVYSGPNTSFATSQDAGGTWYYRVRADSGAGMSAWSNVEAAEIPVYLYLPIVLGN